MAQEAGKQAKVGYGGYTGGSNTLYCEIKCPRCGVAVTSGIGFKVGSIGRLSYKLGEPLKWDGRETVPERRPDDVNLKTIGYFECDNLDCETWQDCYPEVQEALITVADNVITAACPTVHRPNEIAFDIIDSNDVT